ncbi:MAG: hypothetical protein KDJ22_16135, partial [Candidatus Competibacteraceae bacterium]|nr:hypothetical protein [Candidatus Competibacteraceae bacterium]
MSTFQDKPQNSLDKQARLMMLGGLFAAGLATPSPGLAETLNVRLFNSGSGSGKVTSNPPGIDCGLDCTESYALNTTVELTATATSGSVYLRSYVGGTPIEGNPFTVLMDASKSVDVVFAQQAPIADLTVSPSQLSLLGQRGQTATGQIQVSGGTEPYQVSTDRGGNLVQINPTTFEYRYDIPTTMAIGSTIEDVIRVADASVPGQRILEVPVAITVQVDALTAAISSACTGAPGESIPLTGQATGGVSPYNFTWSASAGTIANVTTDGDQTRAEVTFTETGSFPVTLQATDASSPSQTATGTVDCAISAAPLQIVRFAKTPDDLDAYNVGDAIQFTVEAAQGIAPYRYQWFASQEGADWSAFGETAEPTSPPYTFNEPGDYQFQVTVTDSAQPTPQTQTSSPLAFTVEALPDDGDLRAVSGRENAAPNQTVTLSVQFTEGDEPRPNTPVAWTVTTTNGQALPN